MNFLPDLDTPAVVVDLDVLEKNIQRMAARAREAGVRLRPHAKTHKIPEIGRLQLAAGASGISLAKTGEAEVFAAAGFRDLFLAYPIVGTEKARRLLALSDRVRLAVGTDSVEGATSVGAAFHAAGRRLDVLLKVDCGYHRVGVSAERAVETARQIAEVPGSSTPTARAAMEIGGVTECRPGNYVYHDASQVSLGTCGIEDCAMTVLATVISVPAANRAVLDCGSKTLSSDVLRPRPSGHGWILGRKSRIEKLSEEHGVVRVEPEEAFRVGEKVAVLPNHACVVSNLHDRIVLARGERVEGEWTVAARGKVR